MSDWDKKPSYNVCVAKLIPGGKRSFVQVGVGWDTKDGNGIKCEVDLTIILSPSDELFIFLKEKVVKSE